MAKKEEVLACCLWLNRAGEDVIVRDFRSF